MKMSYLNLKTRFTLALFVCLMSFHQSAATSVTDEDKAMELSLRAQFADLDLVDCSDIRGVCAIRHLTKHVEWKNPPVFVALPVHPAEQALCFIGVHPYMPLHAIRPDLTELLLTSNFFA